MKKSCLKGCLITFFIFIVIIITFIVIFCGLIGKGLKKDDSIFSYNRLPDEEFAIVSSDYNIEDRFFGEKSFIESDNVIKLYKTEKDFKNNTPTTRVSPLKLKDETTYSKSSKCEYKFENGLHCYYLNGKCILTSQVEFTRAVILWEGYYIFSSEPQQNYYSLVKDGKPVLSGYMMFVRGKNLVVLDKFDHAKIYDKDLKVICTCDRIYNFADGVY